MCLLESNNLNQIRESTREGIVSTSSRILHDGKHVDIYAFLK